MGVILGIAAIFYIIFGTSDIRIGKINFQYANYTGTVDRFQKVVNKDPLNPEAHLYLGLGYGKKGNYEGAFREFDWLKKNAPDFPISAGLLNEIGMIYYVKEEYGGAIERFKKAASLDKRCSECYFNLGTACSAAGDTQGAIAAYTAALKIDPRHAYSHWNLAIALEKTGDTAGAIKHWQEYARLTPGVFLNPEVERHISELRQQQLKKR